MQTHTHIVSLQYDDPLVYYRRLARVPGASGASCLFESATASERYGRLSLIGLQPTLALTGKDATCALELLDERARPYFEFLCKTYAQVASHASPTKVTLQFAQAAFLGEERERFARRNAAQPIRTLLGAFPNDEKNFFGLYGAFGYRFIYPYEDSLQPQGKTDELGADPTADYRLLLFDTILFFNHLTRECRLYCTRGTEECAEQDAKALAEQLATKYPLPALLNPQVGAAHVVPTDEAYCAQVRQAIQLFEAGELMEMVLSRKLTASFAGEPLALYARYRSINPSPYLFYFDFLDEVLLGASPEMMTRVEAGQVTIRPISGTARRSGNSIEEHHAMLELLNSGKEKSELDMLIDLGRSDLARVCQPGVHVEDYRFIEKYSHVMHTVAQVTGTLDEGLMAYDALIATLNAGTLTGAPKIAAMQYIEQLEQHHRGYYGGAVGYLHFNNELNTGIIIRSAHIKDGQLSYLAGATLLVESDPAAELQETVAKTDGFRAVLRQLATVEATNA